MPRIFSPRHELVRRFIVGGFVASFPIAALLVRTFPFAAIAIVAISHGAFWYATLCPNSAFCVPVIKKFAARGREIWLTFDDGPDPRTTPQVLELLAGHGACATFFLVGESAEKHPALVRQILAEGHGIGNHTYAHPKIFFWAYPPSRCGREIDRCADVLAAMAGQTPHLFRAPLGLHTPLLLPELMRRGLQPVGWTARGLDCAVRNPRRVVRRLLSRLEPGAIFMLHPERREKNGLGAGLLAL
ncbi:MAG: polysaccharide deacetylase family protein, partial [Verrucomicrobiota bacterium]|nr:polysaccharide deacetylase family protein [Verrucomicrobiota bacterium]